MSNIKAIETEYKGYAFRSRLEARWAVFFDALNLEWAYEIEGFELDGGIRYLPDFRVYTPQGQTIWYEIKPSVTLSDEKFSKFAAALIDEQWTILSRARLLSGDPIEHLSRKQEYGNSFLYQNHMCPRCGEIGELAYGILDCCSTVEFGCESCDFETPCGGDNSSEPGIFSIACTPNKGMISVKEYDYQLFQKKIKAAAKLARSARFEHGKAPLAYKSRAMR